MIGRSILDKFINILSYPSSSVVRAVYRHIWWKLRLCIRTILFPTVNKYPILYLYYFRLRRQLHPDKHTDADPLKIVWVNPKRIEKTCDNDFGRPLQRGAVKPGNWDQDTRRFMSRDVPAQVRSYFEENENVDEKLRMKIEKLSSEIVENGFLTQQKLLEKDGAKVKLENNDPVPTILNEITVNIGRNGEVLWRTYGQHRLAIARILDIKRVPVLICVRHKKWQEIRNKIRHTKEYERLVHDTTVDIMHPDLQDLLDEFKNQSHER